MRFIIIFFSLLSLIWIVGRVSRHHNKDLQHGSTKPVPSAVYNRDSVKKFALAAFYRVQDFWEGYFKAHKYPYTRPKLMINDAENRFGTASYDLMWYERADTLTDNISNSFANMNYLQAEKFDSLIGPHYKSLGRKIMLNTLFFTNSHFYGKGIDVDYAYIKFKVYLTIAHEMGHHVQLVVGFTKKFNMKKVLKSSSWVAEYMRQISGMGGEEPVADACIGVWLHDEADRGTLEAFIPQPDTPFEKVSTFFTDLGEDATHGTPEERNRYFLDGYNCSNVDSLLGMSRKPARKTRR